MRIVRQVGGAVAILIALTGCAVDTRATTAIPALPTCEKTLLELNHLSSSLSTKAHIAQAAPGPMRFCRYRWDNGENKLVLMADDTELLAPAALLQALSQLKTVNEVYGPNAVFFCPMMQGNADLIILRAAAGTALTVVQVQRDGCGRVIVTHPGSTSYIAYLSSARLLVQLDAITGTGGTRTKSLPKIRVTPSTNLRDGQQVFVQVSGASPGERFRVSECASAADVNRNGCGDQLALQPFIDTDSSGAGSITFYAKARAATKPYNTNSIQPCTDKCVIMVTGTTVDGESGFLYAPLKFAENITSTATPSPIHANLLENRAVGPVADVLPTGFGWALTTAGLELTPDGGNSFSLVPYPISVLNISDVVLKGPRVVVAGVINSLPVLKSSNDGGTTWKSVALPVGSGKAGFARFVTQNGALIGMLVTDVTSSNFSSAEWYATADGGTTWTHNSIPSGGDVTAAGGDLWLAGGPQFASLYRSADRGATSSKVSPPSATITNAAALSVPGQLKNGNVVLVATSANQGLPAIFRVNVYVSSNHGANWKMLAGTNLVGKIGSGIAAAASVVADSVWLGGATDQGITVISTQGTLTKTSNLSDIYPGGWITSIMPFGNSSTWVTTVNDKCTSGIPSCTEVGGLIRTANGGKTWSLVDLARRPTS